MVLFFHRKVGLVTEEKNAEILKTVQLTNLQLNDPAYGNPKKRKK